ncbi:phospholipid phosphatase-related protein type 2a isoform X4 [Phyllopteryx taeniolatus]|uniref:phospholipid phosphatase-related protein type 2a isoform X4 n=1 Tax=Phyllopteryx taeniolatus TaxID=161469 RepID=UPI002AD38E84|nr:phospholipid phosphatase-related protein type 2a isoform X4 [Phyllopteryx taeniolatus]
MCNGGHYLTCTHITLQTRRSRAETNMALEEKPGVKSSGSIVPCFLFVELVIMAGTVLLAYYFEYTDTFPVHIQGFFCYDKTFSKPYPGPDNTSKIPPVLIYSLVSTLPTLTILAGELCAVFTKAEGTQEKTIVTADCCYFNPLLRRIIRFLGVYAFGLFTTSIFANAGQVVTGNQTPHFLSACRPNYTALGCQSSTQYITERRACTGHPLIVMSARKSFPSKDAALGVYSAAYTAVTCVINSFQQTQPSPSAQRPQRPQSTPGMPMVTLPCVESPLEKFSGPQHPALCSSPPLYNTYAQAF